MLKVIGNNSNKTTLRTLCRVLTFLLILCILIHSASSILRLKGTSSALPAFYPERKNSLDIVYIGSSNTFRSFSPMLMWERYGIASLCYASAAQKIEAYQYMIEEVRKTQPNALLIVSIARTELEIGRESIHMLTDHMHPSMTKIRLVNAYGKNTDIPVLERAEYLLPIIRYHSRWDSLTYEDFSSESVQFKGSYRGSVYWEKVRDVSTKYRVTSVRAPLSERARDVLEQLLDYCDENHLKVLFLAPPQAGREELGLAQTNTLFDYIESRGYPILSMQDKTAEIGLDLSHDYADNTHFNVHGSIKYMDYIYRYLQEHYDIPDRRLDMAYADFQSEAEKYHTKYVVPNVFPFELDGSLRDYSLPAAADLSAEQSGKEVIIRWAPVEEAEGYAVFRRNATEGNGWKLIAEPGSDSNVYIDGSCQEEKKYIYTVIPFRETNGIKAWGNLDYLGVKIKIKQQGGG